MDKNQAGILLKKIVSAYPTFELTSERVQLWVKKMADIEYTLADRRLEAYVETNRFAPTIADILNPDGKKPKNNDTDTMSPAAIIYGHRFVDSDEWN